MARMKAVMAAVLVMEKEGITQAFGVPGAARSSSMVIEPMYAGSQNVTLAAWILAKSASRSMSGRLAGSAGLAPGDPLGIAPQLADDIAARTDPMPAVGRAPNQPRPIKQRLPRREKVIFDSGRVEQIEIHDPIGRYVRGNHALSSRCALQQS